MEYRGLSLFANVGIAETYLKDIGFPIILSNELLKERVDFYKSFYDHNIICGDITQENIFNDIIKKAKESNVNFILATPPCQGMSLAGKMNKDDIRNVLIIKAMDVFKEIKPDFMLIENVPQMLKTFIIVNNEYISIKDYITKISLDLNYNVKFDIFNAADYGTAQTRKRAFVRIYKNNYEWKDPIKEKRKTVQDVIGDLPSLESGQKSNIKFHNAKEHSKNHILWMQHTPTGKTAFENKIHFPQKDGRRIKGYDTTYKRINWDQPAPTITMSNGSISSQNNVHPGRLLENGLYSDARVLTLLEIIRLTGLPNDWNPPEEFNENFIRGVIGEGIPPKLVKSIMLGLVKK